MSPLRDLLLAPRADAEGPDGPGPDARDGSARAGSARAGSARDGSAPSLGLLAPARDLPAAAAAVGLALARGAPAALVCVGAGPQTPAAPRREAAAPAVAAAPAPAAAPTLAAPPREAAAPAVAAAPALAAAPTLAAPPRGAASRLVASLHARGVAAHARGRIVVVGLSGEGDADGFAAAAGRALAAAGALPSVLAVAGRDEAADALLAARDGILVALPASVSPELARLVMAGAAGLGPPAAALTVTLDPIQRALALAGLRAPRAVREAVVGLVG
jgi:Meckel syndrome type 1 protein